MHDPEILCPILQISEKPSLEHIRMIPDLYLRIHTPGCEAILHVALGHIRNSFNPLSVVWACLFAGSLLYFRAHYKFLAKHLFVRRTVQDNIMLPHRPTLPPGPRAPIRQHVVGHFPCFPANGCKVQMRLIIYISSQDRYALPSLLIADISLDSIGILFTHSSLPHQLNSFLFSSDCVCVIVLLLQMVAYRYHISVVPSTHD